MATDNFTPAELGELLIEAEAAWKKIGPLGYCAELMWRGAPYVVTSSQLCLIVDTPAGETIACKWH